MKPPSQYLGITDPYDAYCIDEAADRLLLLMESGKKHPFMEKMTQEEKDSKHKSSLSRAWKRAKDRRKCSET